MIIPVNSYFIESSGFCWLALISDFLYRKYWPAHCWVITRNNLPTLSNELNTGVMPSMASCFRGFCLKHSLYSDFNYQRCRVLCFAQRQFGTCVNSDGIFLVVMTICSAHGFSRILSCPAKSKLVALLFSQSPSQPRLWPWGGGTHPPIVLFYHLDVSGSQWSHHIHVDISSSFASAVTSAAARYVMIRGQLSTFQLLMSFLSFLLILTFLDVFYMFSMSQNLSEAAGFPGKAGAAAGLN